VPVEVRREHIERAEAFCETLGMVGMFAVGFNANGLMTADERAIVVPPLSRIIARNPAISESFLMKYFDYIILGTGVGRYGMRILTTMNAPKSDAVTSEVPNFADARPTPAPQNDVGSLSQRPAPTPMPAPFIPQPASNGGEPLTTQGGEYRISGHGEDGLSGGVESLDQLVSALRQEQQA
jgi:hypothetical protein